MSIDWVDIANDDKSIDVAIRVLSINEDTGSFFKDFLCRTEEAGIDNKEAFKFICLMISAFGGLQVYMPKESTFKKLVTYQLIYTEFKGNNAKELSNKYSISMQAVYRIIKACTKADVMARKAKESLQ